MDSPSDLELLQRFQRGQAMAFEDLVLRHGPGIKGFALRMLRNREQAEEIYTETFLRVARDSRGWVERGTVRGWLYTIAHRLCLDRLRRRQTEARAWASVVEVYADRAVVPSPEASALLGERASELEKALGRLPAEHRDVLLLRTIHGLSAAETAQALGCSEDQVFSRLSYARKRLAELLSEGNQRQGRPA
jgi:RNA polymerase sigma factor (sigma-70 family)